MKDFPTQEIWLKHRVSYGETDAMGMVYHAEYLHYFERSRSEFIRELGGMSYRTMEEKGIALPVREAQCRYRRPARYDDIIYIRAGLREWGRASMTFVYEIYDERKETLLTEGMTEHACVDSSSGKPVRLPSWVCELFEKNRNKPCA